LAAVDATDCAIEGTVNCVRREEGRGLRSTPLDDTGAGAGTGVGAGALAATLAEAFAADLVAVLAVADGALAVAVVLLVVAFNSRLLAVRWVSRGARARGQ